ncbi:tetratricopeptide repeat protein [Pedobacter punctiformis]|uniref:Tetratricopeptide repeat protein n=1 Tax=Pedobacter punctiformis TaxID=3004097 RepID=A0ABT4L9Q1_9SPHI|nr:tetratricopeptide repeat protein [Pedobacter sp. HCMS5-2]MCZ4244639.1 tetratricopeptide repeat protein [Pedobacter sp. HCMS5-2]
MKKLCILLFLPLLGLYTFAQNNAVIDKEKLYDFYQTQRYAEAAQYLKTIYGEDATDFKGVTQMGYCFLMAGNYAEAEKYYVKAYKQQPQNLPILFSLASINSRRGNNDKAKTYYKEIIKIDSNNFNVYKQLANLYPIPTDSLRLLYLQKANKLNPLEGDIAYDLAESYQRLKNNSLAYKTLDVAINADSGNLILQRAKLPVANALKKYDEVIKSGEKLLKDGADGNVLKDVAMAYYYTKRYQKTIDLLKLLESLGMQNESTLYYTTLSYRQLKDYKTAGIYAKKTIDEGISPNTSNYYDLLGLIYNENNQLNLATAAYKKGLQFKANPSIYYHLGILYDFKYKDKKNALIYYGQYLKNKPDAERDAEEIKYTKARIGQLNQGD